MRAENLKLGTLVGTGAVAAALVFLFGAEMPGDGLHADLVEGAALVGALPDNASPNVIREALQSALLGRSISVDTRHFPTRVAVTIHGIDRATCTEAVATARRLEGSVVVELDGYASPSDCARKNDMTWRIMP